jgi:hypothetical protein
MTTTATSLRRWACVATLAAGSLVIAAGADAAEPTATPGSDVGDHCARTMRRLTFDYRPPSSKSDDPRVRLPEPMSIEQRRDIHSVLWPSDPSGRLTVREWLREKNFACLESGFADLETVHARYYDGTSKVISFLSGAKDLVDGARGMTEKEIDALVVEWRSRFPASLIVEVMEVRLLEAAAWQARGPGFVDTVTEEGWRTFTTLNRNALRKAQAFRPAVRDHVLGRYVTLRAMSDTGSSPKELGDFALTVMKNDPFEINLAVYAGTRMVPKWGGSAEVFESYAEAVRSAVGPALQDRAYARLYTFVIGIDDWPAFNLGHIEWIRRGLMYSVGSGASEDILFLQRFACRAHDSVALGAVRRAWPLYAAQPQLAPPSTTLDVSCREWAERLPAP